MDNGVKWYRVIDPLSPLYGCDVSGYDAFIGPHGIPEGVYVNITAMRRIDIFVGDRPFQLVAPRNENLGLLILYQHLEPSPLQNETVELATDAPNGKCLDEYEVERGDHIRLRIAYFKEVAQLALTDHSSDYLTDPHHQGQKTTVLVSGHMPVDEVPDVRKMFERGDDWADVQFKIESILRKARKGL